MSQRSIANVVAACDASAQLDASAREKLLSLAARYHLRNGVKYADGSMGEVCVTHNALVRLLSEAYALGQADKFWEEAARFVCRELEER